TRGVFTIVILREWNDRRIHMKHGFFTAESAAQNDNNYILSWNLRLGLSSEFRFVFLLSDFRLLISDLSWSLCSDFRFPASIINICFHLSRKSFRFCFLESRLSAIRYIFLFLLSCVTKKCMLT